MNQQQWRQLTPGQQDAHIAHHGPPPASWTTSTAPRHDTRYAAAPATPQVVVVERKRRRIWPWALLAVVLIPVLIVAGCAALIGGAATSIDNARKGGTVAIGQTYTYADGVALSVSAITPYQPSDDFEVGKNEVAYQGEVTVVNGSHNPIGTALVTTNVSVNGTAAQPVYDGQVPPSQDLATGQTAKIPFRFKVTKVTKGALQVSVAAELNEPVFFTGSLG